MTWTFALSAAEAKSNVIGGGISFQFEPSNTTSVSPGPSSPNLLPDQSGWEIPTGKGPIRLQFDSPLPRLFFEPGRANEIRAFLVNKTIVAGTREIRMTVTLPESGRLSPTIAERLGTGPDDTWIENILDGTSSPVDLSFLNEPEQPAGKRGFLKAIGDEFVFEDGSKARFWGTNIVAYALFSTDKNAVEQHARRLSKLGYNLVRFHHHDSKWVNPNIFGGPTADTLTLDDEMLERLDWWIACLKAEGIYVWLDLHVERNFSAGDGIAAFEEIAKGKAQTQAKGFTHVNEDIQQRLQDFNTAFLTHVNRHTGLAYKDDPAIVGVLVTNENDVTNHFGNALLPNKNVPRHNENYMAAASGFAKTNGLSESQTWRSWEHGPSKLFLNDLEHRFNKTMIQHLRDIGLKVPIATTNTWGRNPLASLPALTDGDMVDAHAYGQPNLFESDPRYKANLVQWMAAAQIAGKPLTVSEWNASPFPAFDRFSLPLYVASIGRLQAWDALMHYGYSQIALNKKGRAGNWLGFNDPGTLAMMPAAALIFRQGHVRQAAKTYVINLPSKELFNVEHTANRSAALRTLPEHSRMVIAMPETPELPWLKPAPESEGTTLVFNANRDFVPPGQDFVQSDTGELYRNWREGMFAVNTARSQLAAGWIGGKKVKLMDAVATLTNKNAAVAIQSLDGQAIRQSNKLLISFASRSQPKRGDRLPYLSEPVEGTLNLTAPAGLELVKLDKSGKQSELPVIFKDGSYAIEFTKKLGTHWLLLQTPSGAQ